MFSRLLVSAALAVAVAALVPSPNRALAGTDANRVANDAATTFTDAAGDSGTAPDITTVAVSNDAAGQITFRIAFAGALAKTDDVFILLDTDQNRATGDPHSGADYALGESESDTSFGVVRWDGTSWQDAPASSIRLAGGANQLTFSINRGDLGGTSGFDFWVDSVDTGGDPPQLDRAPDTGAWNYKLQMRPLTLSIAGFELDKANGTLTAALLVARGDTGGFLGDEGAIQCRASIGGRPLAPSFSGFVTISRQGVKVPIATCVWAVPRRLRGKTIKGTMSITFEGVAVKRSFSAVVR